MKIKVSTAEGATLNWMVAKAEGLNVYIPAYAEQAWIAVHDDTGIWRCPSYSTDWAQGGPIIERERISIRQWINVPIVHAYMPEGEWSSDGQSPLIAAMRCYVVSKLGEEVEAPDELA